MFSVVIVQFVCIYLIVVVCNYNCHVKKVAWLSLLRSFSGRYCCCHYP